MRHRGRSRGDFNRSCACNTHGNNLFRGNLSGLRWGWKRARAPRVLGCRCGVGGLMPSVSMKTGASHRVVAGSRSRRSTSPGVRPSGGDIACGAHVGVARPRRAGYAPGIVATCTRPGPAQPDPAFVLQPDLQQAPAAATDRPVQPTLLRNMLPGRSTVPLALWVMARTSRASIGIVSKRRAIVVLTARQYGRIPEQGK